MEVRLSYTVWLAIHPGLPRFTNLPHAPVRAKLAWMLDHPPANPTAAGGNLLAMPAQRCYTIRNIIWPVTGCPTSRGQHPSWLYSIPAAEVSSATIRPPLPPHRLQPGDSHWAPLHNNYVVGDLNESNILVKSSALVSLIDIDSFQVQERNGGQMITYACRWLSQNIPPELQGVSIFPASSVRLGKMPLAWVF